MIIPERLKIGDTIGVVAPSNPIIDENDPIDENYILDVCSKEKGSEYDEQ